MYTMVLGMKEDVKKCWSRKGIMILVLFFRVELEGDNVLGSINFI